MDLLYFHMAIYIVRDRRSTLVSFYHFLSEVRTREGIDMPRVLEGWVSFGWWSRRLQSWQSLDLANALLVRFADRVEDPRAAVHRMAACLGIDKAAKWNDDLARLREIFPGVFRFGSNARNMVELILEHEKLIWPLHGECTRRLGYQH